MKSYRVKYTLEKVVVVEANNPQEAVDKAADLEDFNYDFFRDGFLAEEMQEKTTSTIIYIEGQGVTQFNRRVSEGIPKEEREFDNIESLEFLHDSEDCIELRLISFNMNPLEIMQMGEKICQQRLLSNKIY